MDRFLMHVNITYPPVEDEVEVIRLVRGEEIAAQAEAAKPSATEKPAPIPQQAVFDARAEIGQVHTSDAMDRYMADLVQATRTPAALDEDLARWITVGASPRASLALDRCSRAHAWMSGRDYVDPQDVRAIVHDVFRHRISLSFEAQGEDRRTDDVTDAIVRLVALP
jgi:MoxR-like ATPase